MARTVSALTALAFAAGSFAVPTFASAQSSYGYQGGFLDRFSAECKRGAIYGAIGGGVLGAIASKDKNRVENGVMGAVVGAVGGCLIMRSIGGNDRSRLNTISRRAAETGYPVTETWRNADGRDVEATAYPVNVRSATGGQCRRSDVNLYVDGYDNQNLRGDTYCQNRSGRWAVVAT
jgi:surface antigen